MKVWGKIAKEMMEQLKHNYTTKEAVKSDMYMMRITSCDTERQFGYVGLKRLKKDCAGRDCVDCLDKYLDMEVAEK